MWINTCVFIWCLSTVSKCYPLASNHVNNLPPWLNCPALFPETSPIKMHHQNHLSQVHSQCDVNGSNWELPKQPDADNNTAEPKRKRNVSTARNAINASRPRDLPANSVDRPAVISPIGTNTNYFWYWVSTMSGPGCRLTYGNALTGWHSCVMNLPFTGWG